MERMKKLEERLKESEDKETIASQRLEKIEDKLKENEEGKGQELKVRKENVPNVKSERQKRKLRKEKLGKFVKKENVRKEK